MVCVQADDVLRKLQADKEREHRLRCERRNLIQQSKADKVERQKKREEFMRMQILEKIHEKLERTQVPCDAVRGALGNQPGPERQPAVTRHRHCAVWTWEPSSCCRCAWFVQALERAKEESLRQHQKMQIAMKKQRQFIVESMEMAKKKKDWGKARDLVNMALTQGSEDDHRISTSKVLSAPLKRTHTHAKRCCCMPTHTRTPDTRRLVSCCARCRLECPAVCACVTIAPVRVCLLAIAQSLPNISRPRGDDWDEFAAQRTAKMYADKAAKMEADLMDTRGGGGGGATAGFGPESLRDAAPASSTYKSPYELVKMERKKASGPVSAVPAFAHVSGGTL